MDEERDSSGDLTMQKGLHDERFEPVATRLSRRRLLIGMAATGSVSLSGCLSVGPTVETSSLANSLVFDSVALGETFSFGGNRVTASVRLKPAAFDLFGVTELDVLAARARPFSTGDADTPPGSFRTSMNVPVDLPAGEPATISAVNERGTTVESIRVTNDAAAFLTGLGAGGEPIQTRLTRQLNMPTRTLTSGFERRRTEFSTNAEMHGRIRNTAQDGELSHLVARATFTNDAGEAVDRSAESVEGLSAGEVWNVVVPYGGDASDATGGELAVTDSIVGRSPIPPTNVTVLEDGLERPDDELRPPRVVGEVRNTGSSRLPFLEASAKFYAESGDVLGSDSAGVTGLNAGQTWSFEIPFYAHSTERAESVADYELSFVA